MILIQEENMKMIVMIMNLKVIILLINVKVQQEEQEVLVIHTLFIMMNYIKRKLKKM